VFGRATTAGLTARLVALCALLLAISAGGFALLLSAARDLNRADDGLRRSLERIGAEDEMLRLVVDLETGIRGYVVNGDPVFLEPYRRGQAALPGEERRLEAMTAGEPQLARRARAIVAAVDEDRRFEAGQVRRAQRDRKAAARVIALREGKRRVDAIRRRFAGLLSLERTAADARRADASSAEHRLFVMVVTGLLVLPLLVLLIAAYAARGVVAPLRRIAAGARRVEAGELDARVPEGGSGEVADLARSFNAMASSLERGHQALEHHNAELEAQGAELAQTVTALAREKARVEAFHEFVALLASEPELDRLAPLVLARLQAAAGAHAGALYALDPADPAGGLRQVAAQGALGAGGTELRLPLRAGGLDVGLVALAAPAAPADGDTLERMAGAAAVALSNAVSLAAARHQAELNRAVLETAHDAYIAVDADLRITAWTPQATELSGYAAEEALGRRVDELLVPQRHREAYRFEHRHLLDHGGARQFELPLLHRDGHELRVELSASTLQVGDRRMVNGFVRDITERVARERAREAQRAVSMAIAEADPAQDVMPPILEALGRTLRWAAVVHAVPEPDGGTRAAAVWRDPALPAGADPGDSALEVALGGENGRLEFRDRRATAPDPELGDALQSIAALIAEVLERRRAEAEADRLKNEFFALVSHELRTPLTSIVGYVELLLEEQAGEIEPMQRKFLGVIERNGRRLQRLVGDLLFVAQFEAGKLSLERGTVELHEVALEAVEAARPRAGRADVALEADVEPVPRLEGDRDRLGQVVDNLISNALKFTPTGGRVTVRLRERDGQAALEVADTGMGIPEEEQSRLFERFYRASGATERSIPGIGLGLAICRAIAEAHGGSIRVSSEAGAGTTFCVMLPLGTGGSRSTREVTGVQQR
jgi:PAS domain S-box-containing protein